MPVKKKKITKKVKREIKRAVDGLPGLMIEHVKFPELPAPERYEEIETKAIKSLPYEDENILRQKKIWLWTGVTIFSAIVFLMWGWNMRSAFQDSFTNTEKQPGITETAKTTWKETVDMVESNKPAPPAENLDEIKNQIKTNIAGLLSTVVNTTNTEPTN